MSDSYTYDPDAWHPAIAGLVAGAIAAIVAAVLAVLLRSPDEIVANSLSVVLVSLALGLVAGMLWRRIRLTARPLWTFGWTMAGGFFVAMLAVTIVDQTVLSNVIAYAAPIAALIFITLGFLTPLLAGVTAPVWVAAIPVLIALAMGIGLFGRGNVASGELTLDSITTTTGQVTTPTESPTTGSDSASSDSSATTTTTARSLSGEVTIPDDLAEAYTVAGGLATYSVEELLQGLSTQGVGVTDSIVGTIVPQGAFSFTIDLQSFESDQSRRDSRVVGWFEDNPLGTFEAAEFELPATAIVGEVQAFDVVGTMTVNQISQEITFAVEARIEQDGSLSVTGETFIVLSEFDVPVIDSGFVQMEDGATIEVAFAATPVG